MEKVFSALADPNRRRIIELLHDKDSTLLELTKSFTVSFQALSKHIQILENAEIINKEKKGKYRMLSLNRNTLRLPLDWIAYYSNFWDQSFDKLSTLLNEKKSNGNDN